METAKQYEYISARIDQIEKLQEDGWKVYTAHPTPGMVICRRQFYKNEDGEKCYLITEEN